MLHTTIKIDSGIRIITLGSIAIALASFIKQNCPDADTALFLLSGISLLFSGLSYLLCNYLEIPNMDIIEKEKPKYQFVALLFLKHGYLGFVVSRVVSVSFLYMGIFLFIFASTGLFKIFNIPINDLSAKFIKVLPLIVLIVLYSLFLPATYKDFE